METREPFFPFTIPPPSFRRLRRLFREIAGSCSRHFPPGYDSHTLEVRTGPDRFADRICVLHLPLISTLIAGLSLPSPYAVERWNLSYCEVFRRMMLLLNLVVFTMCLIGILFIAAYNT